MKLTLKTHSFILFMITLLMVGCNDGIIESPSDGGGAMGEPIVFSTLIPNVADSYTRSTAQEEWKKDIDLYQPVFRDYTFKVEMWQKDAATATATGQYIPTSTVVDGKREYSVDGTLQNKENPLYWQDNVNEWGFKATTVSSESIETDQHTQNLWLYQDLLEGYSYLPIWDETTNESQYDLNAINYRTSKQWYADNKKAKTLSGLMVAEGSNGEEYKKIPLYMQHKRAWITIVLHAGEGVKREALKFATAEENIKMSIYSYAAGAAEPVIINKAWPREEFIDYAKDKNGEAEYNVSTTRYDAIVAPHNYATNKDEEVIAKINLSNQNFSFYAGNDDRFLSDHTAQEVEAALNAYNLEAGKHLTIDVTLSRESRKILITAWIEDWTEVATATICDDYGQNGDPIVIKDREELIAFLSDDKKNKQGSVALIQPTELVLDYTDKDGNQVSWLSTYDLKATLNLAGCTLKTKSQLVNDITSSGNLVNGTILMLDGAVVPYAVAKNNDGTIERVDVKTTSENSTATATIAGMVGKNSGTIYQCSSALPVYATEASTIQGANASEIFTGYIGGIAAVSKAKDGSSMAVIDGCTVNASVNGVSTNTDIKGGGIVGYADGRVSNNTYEYGITVSQSATQYKNIFVTAHDLRAYGNGWPTTVTNPIDTDGTNPNTYAGTKFDAVIDCQEELHALMQSDKNISNKNYRISKSFTVSSTNDASTDWTHGTVNANDFAAGVNNVSFNLDGNNKIITLTGTKEVSTTKGTNLSNGEVTTYTTAPMLFNYVLGEIKDLTLYLEKPVVASPSEKTDTKDGVTTVSYNAEDAIAPLAYAVYGENGKLTNIKVKAKTSTEPSNPEDDTPQSFDAYVQASTPAGLVVWAYGGASINDCAVKVPVRMWLPEDMGSDAKHYAGGIVACAAVANISRSQYLGNSETSLTGADASTSATKSASYYYGGIVGGTAIKGNEKPKLYIADCSSWYITSPANTGDKSSKGAIIAYACFADTDASSKITNGMNELKPSEGNWWTESAKGVNTWADGLTEEKTIGKKNASAPSYDSDFDKL